MKQLSADAEALHQEAEILKKQCEEITADDGCLGEYLQVVEDLLSLAARIEKSSKELLAAAKK